MSNKKVNWLKIKNEYISTNISLRKLAEKYNVSYSTIAKKAAREEWEQKRNQNGIILESKIQQKTIEKVSDKKAEENIQELVTKDFVLKNLYQIALQAEKDSDRNKSLELLGKHLKLFTDKVETDVKGSFNILKLQDQDND